jgi:hypothetical protein
VTPVFSLFSPRRVASGVLLCAALAACDDDPSSPKEDPPVAQAVGDAIMTRQGDIRVVIPGGIDPASALDPANFVVINACTGLRVPGALRLGGDTVVFTPSATLPYLTPLSIRVQNIQNLRGVGMDQPFTFVRTTEAPPVTDVSWSTMSSPTGDPISGVDFVSRTVGYVQTIAAELYRTQTGGRLFEAVYKDPNVSLAKGLRAVSRDTLYMIAAPNFGGTTFTTYGLFRSRNAGLTFDSLFTSSPSDMRSLSRERVGNTDILFIAGNVGGSLATFRYNGKTGETTISPTNSGGNIIGNGGDISPDTTKAVAVGFVVEGFGPLRLGGVVYRSTNSGRTITQGTLPANTRALQGAGFIDNTTALLVGDSSGVYRYNVTTGVATRITAGVPQTFNDPVSRTVETFTFRKAEFSPDNRQIGWVIGELLRRVPGFPDVRRGVILMTRDGGNTFTRQAVAGVEDLGLGFPSLGEPSDISALATDFVVTGGYNGFLAARIDDTQAAAEVCSFETP